MAKTITVEAFTPAEYNKGLLVVKAQSHRGVNFGENGSNKFTASNGITLGSNRYPARDKVEDNTIWFRGSDSSKDGNTVGIPSKRLQKVLDAVKEYNAYFSDAAIFGRNLAAAVRKAEADRAAAEAARKAEAARLAALQPQGIRIVGYKQIVG